MWRLYKRTVDTRGNGSLQYESNEPPTRQELIECISQYFDDDVSEMAAFDLIRSGYASMGDMSCTEFSLEEI